jgi:hypothetical protein
MRDSFLALGRKAVFATNDSWRKKLQIPSSKSQVIFKSQIPKSKPRLSLGIFGDWDFLGAWALGFGTF